MVTNRRAAWLLWLVLPGAAWSRESATPAACLAAASQPPILDATTVLGGDPEDLRARFKLADAWSDIGCFGDAIRVLQAGAEGHPHDKELQERLRVATSLVSEQTYFEKVDQAAEDAHFTRAAFRCTKLAELDSCDEALDMKPDDPLLLIAQADALTQLNRPGEAIGVYRRALRGMPDQPALRAKIIAAETQRKMLLDTCETQTGEAARRACVSAWLPGSPDEVRVLARRGLLLQIDNQLPPALDAYMAAARLRPGDRAIAQSVVTLCDSTRRMDAVTLTAKGAALNTLGRASDAATALRQALQLAPDLAAAKTELLVAERAASGGPPVRVAEVTRSSARGVKGVRLKTAAAQTAAVQTAAPAALFSNDAPPTRTN